MPSDYWSKAVAERAGGSPGFLARLGETWPARLAKSAYGAFTLPGDVYAGRADPMSDEGIGRAADLAGMVMGGAYGAAPAGSLGMAGARRLGPADFERMLAEQRGREAAAAIPVGPETIASAAVKYGDRVFTGRSHREAGRAALESGLPLNDMPFEGAGFITSKGRFVSREETARLAEQSGQSNSAMRIAGRATAQDFNVPEAFRDDIQRPSLGSLLSLLKGGN